jgi:hypothetical protein
VVFTTAARERRPLCCCLADHGAQPRGASPGQQPPWQPHRRCGQPQQQCSASRRALTTLINPAKKCAARNNGKASTARQIVDAQLRRPRPHTEPTRCRHPIRCAGRGTAGGQAAVRRRPSIEVCMHPNPPPLSASAPEPPLATTSCEPC